MKYPVQRVNVDFTLNTLEELDAVARELNISRQTLIKTYIRQSLYPLDQQTAKTSRTLIPGALQSSVSGSRALFAVLNPLHPPQSDSSGNRKGIGGISLE